MTASPTEAEPAREMVEAINAARHNWIVTDGIHGRSLDVALAKAAEKVFAIRQLDPAFLHASNLTKVKEPL